MKEQEHPSHSIEYFMCVVVSKIINTYIIFQIHKKMKEVIPSAAHVYSQMQGVVLQ